MSRLHAVFFACLIAFSAIFVVSLLVASGVQAAPQPPGEPLPAAPARTNPLSFGEIALAQAPLSCTYYITTPFSIVTNNFTFATTASLLPPLDPLSLLPSSVPASPSSPITVSLETQYFRVDALAGYHYLVSAIPNSLSTYNLRIVVFNSSFTPVLTSTKPLAVLSASVDFVPSTTGLYYFAISHIATNCPSGTYRVTVDGPATATPSPTGSPTVTRSPTPVTTALPGADRFEPNYDFDHAGLLALNVKYTGLNFVPSALADPYSRDDDWFRVCVKPGLLVTCETLELGPGVDTNLILYDNNRNGIGGNDDKDRAGGDFGSRVSYYVTYEGYLYLDVGQPFALAPTEVSGFSYSVQCVTGTGPTSTPSVTRPPVTPAPTIPQTPTPIPTLPPTPTPTPPFIQVRPWPTVTPPGQRSILVPINLQVYYDLNDNRDPDPGEGVVGISARVIDVTTGQELAHGFTDEFGFASLTVNASGVVRLVVPYLNYSVVIQPSGSSIALRIASHTLPKSIP